MSNLLKIRKAYPEIVQKSWGHEEIFANTEEYCGKLLVFDTGTRGSAHFHVEKLEHFRILSGVFKLECIDPFNADLFVLDLKAGDIVEIPRGHVHRIVCMQGGTILEVSTHDSAQDSYRVGKGDSQS